MGSSYHYSSASQFFFAAGDPIPNPTTHKPARTVRVPVTSPPAAKKPPDAAAAAARIQAAFRSQLVRRHFSALRSADREATRLERLLRRQETVDAVRGDDRERARFSEALMAVLLRLDAVPGYDPAVREARRAVSRSVVGLQEVFDSVLAAPEADTYGVPASLGQVLEGIWGVREAPAAAAAVGEQEAEARRSGTCWGRFFRGTLAAARRDEGEAAFGDELGQRSGMSSGGSRGRAPAAAGDELRRHGFDLLRRGVGVETGMLG